MEFPARILTTNTRPRHIPPLIFSALSHSNRRFDLLDICTQAGRNSSSYCRHPHPHKPTDSTTSRNVYSVFVLNTRIWLLDSKMSLWLSCLRQQWQSMLLLFVVLRSLAMLISMSVY
jgi:hypothetical protein